MQLLYTKQISILVDFDDRTFDEIEADNYDIVLDQRLEAMGFSVDHSEITNPDDE